MIRQEVAVLTYALKTHQKTLLPLSIIYDNKTPKHERSHLHDCCEIMFIRSGYGWCSVNGVNRPILPGDLYLMGEQDEHEFFLKQGGAYYTVMFQPEIIPAADRQELSKSPFFFNFGTSNFRFVNKCNFPIHTFEHVSRTLEQMLRESQDEKIGRSLLLQARFFDLLAHIAKQTTLFPANFHGKTDDLLGSIINYALEHYQEKISLADLGKLTRRSPEYLGKFFRRHAGINLTDYLAYLRIEQARLLMEDQKLSLGEIAFRTGFYDSAHFTRTFQRVVGMTPRQFLRHLSPEQENYRK